MTELKSFDRVAAVYDQTRGLPEHIAGEIADGIAATLRGISRAPRLLEVGIGTGRMAVPLAARGVRVTGVDISTGMLDVLRGKREDIDVLVAEGGSLPFRDAIFDAALFVHILHLVPDPAATIHAALAAVRPGGCVIAGSDAPREGIRDEAEGIIRQAVLEVTGLDLGGWKPYEETQALLERITRDAGATLARRNTVAWDATTSAARMIERLERRDFSSSWRIPAERLPEVLDLLRPRLIALFGGLDVEAAFPRAFTYAAWQLPGG